MDPNISEEEIRQHVWVQGPIRRALDEVIALRRRLRQLVGNDIQRVEEKASLLKQANEALELIRLGADLLVATTLHNLSKHKQRKDWKSWSDDNNIVGTGLAPVRKRDDNNYFDYTKSNPNIAIAEPSNDPASAQNTNELPTTEEYAFLLDSFETARRENLNEETRQRNLMAFAHMRERIDAILGERPPFHWPLMFPEVFVEEQVNPGFAALVSNPPFQGGKRITGALGTDYRNYLVEYLANGKRGHADLCAYFFLRASDLVQQEGQAGLVATNTIAQGDTREVGLDQIRTNGWTFPRAIPSRTWPGSASLEIAYVWLRRGDWHGLFVLGEKPVEGISPHLTPSVVTTKKYDNLYKLGANESKSFIGSYVLGTGFVLDPFEAKRLIEKDSRNKDVIFPYLNAEDLNSRPDQSPSRWVINFHGWPLEQAETYPDCIELLREKVKPEREKQNDKYGKDFWWLYLRNRPALYNAISNMEQVLVVPRHSKYMLCSWEPTGIIFSDATCVIASGANATFALIQCTFHSDWARVQGSSMRNDLRYTPSDCFETFPFPTNMDKLEDIGERYYNHCQSIMLTRQEGLTQTYNHFHNPQENSSDIVQLRELHREMDEAVAAAYGWDDLALEHGFHETRQGLRYTISEAALCEVLDRLLRLNHERYAEEVAQGLHDKGTKAKRGQKQAPQTTKATPLGSRAHKPADQVSIGKARKVAETGVGYEGKAGSDTRAKGVGGSEDVEELRQGSLFDDMS